MQRGPQITGYGNKDEVIADSRTNGETNGYSPLFSQITTYRHVTGRMCARPGERPAGATARRGSANRRT
ncbi:hypothetical protein GCM10009780_64840 [Actinomadura alba]